jgi:hypothetical protein
MGKEEEVAKGRRWALGGFGLDVFLGSFFLIYTVTSFKIHSLNLIIFDWEYDIYGEERKQRLEKREGKKDEWRRRREKN